MPVNKTLSSGGPTGGTYRRLRNQVSSTRGVDPLDVRSDFGRDYGRVIHSGAFRRMQAKSQVVHVGHADWFRTRLTHTLEVAQIARDTARRVLLRGPGGAAIDGPLLVETAALIHDLGHPPFGHNGESELKDWMDSLGSSFEANAQSFRIVTVLEVKFPSSAQPWRFGLDLTAETLAASLKYAWPQGANPRRKDNRKFGFYSGAWAYENDADEALNALTELPDIPSYESPERRHAAAALTDWSDDVAYSVHDLEDGIRAKMIPFDFLVHGTGSIVTGARKAIVARAAQESLPSELRTSRRLSRARARHREAFERLRTFAPVREIDSPYVHSDRQRGTVKTMTSGLIDRFAKGISVAPGLQTARTESELAMSADVRDEMEVMKALNWIYVIESRELQTMQFRERRMIRALCDAYLMDGAVLLPSERKALFAKATELDQVDWPKDLPAKRLVDEERRQYSSWSSLNDDERRRFNKRHRARVVCDHVAGMTDRFAEHEFARLTGAQPQSISDFI
jgi:dGTPase